MKCFVALALITLVLVNNGQGSPIDGYVGVVPEDNSHYVEGVSRYIWMPDGTGKAHLVDLDQPADEDTLSRRSGADNQYWLYTRLNPNNPQFLLHGDASSIWASNYNGGRPLKVIVHGWNSNGNSDVNSYVRDAFLATADCNVIVVDWRRLANSWYNTGVRGVPSVGEHLGHFLIWLINTAGGNWNNVHLVGFSLGAHVVGIAGRTAGGRPTRVTGLDPAGPRWGGNSLALQATDGQYVEAIHTNGGALGINDPIGGTNFYPNGGRNQPGCLGVNVACSHSRAYQFFASSIYTNHLVGRQCSRLRDANRNRCNGVTLHMGNDLLHKRGGGLYALSTARRWPF